MGTQVRKVRKENGNKSYLSNFKEGNLVLTTGLKT